jgi:hypothetical protein
MVFLLPSLPLFSPAAISQSSVVNTQTQTATVGSSETLNVVEVSGSVSGVSTATGDSAADEVASGALNVQTSQTMAAPVTARNVENLTTNGGPQTVLVTTATANTGDAASYEGGALTGTINQTVTAAGLTTAATQFNASGAQTGDMSMTTQAIGNAHTVEVSDTSASMTLNQTNNATTGVNGDAVIGYTPGTASASATAMANSVNATGTGNASQTLTVNQVANGQTVSEQDANAGNAQTIVGSATSTGDNLAVTNQNGSLAVTDNQTSTGYIQAQAQVSGYQFGTGQASAYGVGNSAVAENVGPSLSFDNSQSSTGTGIVVNASFTGQTGYDASASATAIANAATGYACSECGGVINIANTQTSNTVVAATSEIDIAGSNRSVTAAATAVGNSASFYVSKPH